MSTVQANISMSVDGFVTGPSLDQFPGLGADGEILHAWLDDDGGDDLAFSARARRGIGAVITSRKVYELTDGWGPDGLYRMPVFVVTHRPHHPVSKMYTSFVFVDGVEAAVEQAREAAGTKIVHVMGGASIIQQALAAGLVDELVLHVAPILLGSGTRLFDALGSAVALERSEVIETRSATHLRYRVLR